MQMSLHLGKHYRVWLLLFLAVTCLGAAAEKSEKIRLFANFEQGTQTANLRLVKNIRIWSSRTIKKDRELMADYDKKNRPNIAPTSVKHTRAVDAAVRFGSRCDDAPL